MISWANRNTVAVSVSVFLLSCHSICAFYAGEYAGVGLSCRRSSSLVYRNAFSPSPLDKIGSLFSTDDTSGLLPRPPSVPPPETIEEDDFNVFFSLARAFLSSDLGALDNTLLDKNFLWINPYDINPLGKKDYLIALNFFDLRKSFPDLDYRAHDFRLDPHEPYTIRFTSRTVGTMRNSLQLRNSAIPPNGRVMKCPPETISITFSSSGKVTKLCSGGFVMDRLVGNTGGVSGVAGAAAVAGNPVSAFDTTPPLAVIGRFFGRTLKPLSDPETFLAPFPETVMVQLAKGVVANDIGAEDSDLLSEDFVAVGPVTGPINKETFLENPRRLDLTVGFPDLNYEYSNWRVDPFDPYRVWADRRGSGTRTGSFGGISTGNGASFKGPPEAVSFTFDDNGYCTRATLDYILDPSVGNTGGLAGIDGILYATGTPSNPLTSRPIPQILSRIHKSFFESFTGIAVDEYVLEKTSTPSIIANTPIVTLSKKVNDMVAPPKVAPKLPPNEAKLSIPKFNKPKPSLTSSWNVGKVENVREKKSFEKTDNLKMERKNQEEKKKKKQNEVKKMMSIEKEKNKKMDESKKMKMEDTKKKKLEEAKKMKVEEARKKKMEDTMKKKMEDMKKKKMEKKKNNAALSSFTPSPKSAKNRALPRGVPALRNWRKNRDGSVTGLICGSLSYDDGEKITTSTILSGVIQSKNVIRTESGSKYYLE